jgi:SAM-dependent methyltransferase
VQALPPMPLPWWLKIAGKVVISRLPVSYERWASIGVFRHGQMDNPAYAQQVFAGHVSAAGFDPGARSWVGLELGPGDSAASAVIAAAHGAERFHLIDDGDYARRDPRLYAAVAAHLRGGGHDVPALDGRAFEDMLGACRATYATEGVRSLRALPDASVDFVYSQAVLEHVHRDEFADLMRELRRILAPGGVASHQVDLKDHLADGLNHLRFGERLWEAPGFARASGFYTNRIRFGEMLRSFEAAGFDVEVVQARRWPAPPIARARLAAPFRDLPQDDLLVSGFRAVLR